MSIAGATLDSSVFEYIRDLVLRRAAIVLDQQKSYLVESRLNPVAQKHGLKSLAELVDQLRSRSWSQLHQLVVEALTTNETSFFRDLHPFDTLRTLVFPDLQKRRSVQRSINIWSAACSTGQEPYTISIILREHFPAMHTWRVRMYASDISQQVLIRAREGIYNQSEINRGLPASVLVKYFRKHGLQWEVKEDIRRMVEFMEINLIENWPPLPTMDVCFLRNVLIYFSTDTKRRILANLRQRLAPDGYLFLGGAETTLGLDDQFERLQDGKTAYYRLRG